MDEGRIQNLIGIIYDAALDPQLWINVVHQLKTMTNSRHGHLWSGNIHDDVQKLLSERNRYLAFENDYFSFSEFRVETIELEASGILDPHLNRQHQAPEGRASLGRDLVPLEELQASDYYNEFGRHFGLFQMLGSVMIRNQEAVSALGLFRSEQDALYSDREARILDIFLPHVRRSLNLYGRLQVQNGKTQVLQSSIDTLSSAIILVNDTGKVIFLNAAANRLIKRRPELAVRRGKLHAKSHADTVQLEHLTRRATGSDGQRPIGGAVAVQRADGGPPLQIIAAPVSPDNRTMLTSSVGAVALVVIHDPNEQAYIPQEMIRTMFGLTPAEAELLLALSHGQTPKQYSDEHHVTVNTARTHLKSLFAKTQTAKQSDLVRLMSGLMQSVALSQW